MAEIMDAVHKNFALLPDAEVSVECNPGTVTAVSYTHLDVYKRQRMRCSVSIRAIMMRVPESRRPFI